MHDQRRKDPKFCTENLMERQISAELKDLGEPRLFPVLKNIALRDIPAEEVSAADPDGIINNLPRAIAPK